MMKKYYITLLLGVATTAFPMGAIQEGKEDIDPSEGITVTKSNKSKKKIQIALGISIPLVVLLVGGFGLYKLGVFEKGWPYTPEDKKKRWFPVGSANTKKFNQVQKRVMTVEEQEELVKQIKNGEL